VSSVQARELRSLGPEYVGHSIWKQLRFDEVFLSSGISRELLPLLETLVIGRLIEPGSERHTCDWAENRSAIYELIGRPLRYSLSSFYRAGDTLFSFKNDLEAHLSKQEKDLFSLPERMCFLDLTNTYFEGNINKNPKAQRGHCKKKRSDCKLLTLALIVDEHGFIKYSNLYPGNQYEGDTLKNMIESLVKIRPELAKHRTVILDAGIANEENVNYLKKNQFHYIVVNRGKSEFTPEDTGEMKVIREEKSPGIKIEVKRFEKGKEAYLLCRSTNRQAKDRGIRTRQEKLFLERLKYFKDGLKIKGRTKRYAKVAEMIGRLREKYPRASKIYEVELIAENTTEKNKTIKTKDIVWKMREQYEEQSKLDGCYVLRTDLLELSDKEIWETYVMLTRVEKAFKSMKSSLGLRPNFHQKEYRADTHMFISVLAYHILHTIEYKLRQHGDHRSWETIRDILSTHQRLTIQFKEKIQSGIQQHHIRLCSKTEPEHETIYQRLRLPSVPLPRKIYVAK
jgi:transposase